MENKIPPYFQNFDGSHCLQCSLRSILEYFNPQKQWTWEELDKISNKEPDKATWHMSFLSNLGKLGYEVVCIENFDLIKFIEHPEAYLKQTNTAEGFAYIMQDINIPNEIKASQALLKAADEGLAELHYRNHTADDIRNYLKAGYCIIHWVNSRALNFREGHTGHFVMVYRLLDEDNVMIHENGGLRGKEPTGMPEMRVSIAHLLASGTSGANTGGFYAIRPKS